MTYKIKFSSEYYNGVLVNPALNPITGRLMLFQREGDAEWVIASPGFITPIYDDFYVNALITYLRAHENCTQNDLSDFSESRVFADHEGTTETITKYNHIRLATGAYFTLDDSYNDSSKVLRTLATGQSDITRHEAYTKAQGLNEFNSLTPSYTSGNLILKQMLQIVKKSVPEATQIVLYYPNSLYRASNIYNIGEARLAVVFPNNYIRQIVSNIVSTEGASSIANFDTIPVAHSINSESQYKEVRDFDYVIPTVYTGNSGVISSTGSAYDSYAIVSEEDLIALLNLLNNLSNTSMDLYFGVGGK